MHKIESELRNQVWIRISQNDAAHSPCGRRLRIIPDNYSGGCSDEEITKDDTYNVLFVSVWDKHSFHGIFRACMGQRK